MGRAPGGKRRAAGEERLPFGGGATAVWTWISVDRGADLLEVFRDRRRTPWLDAAEAAVGGDWEDAAGRYRQIGAPAEEAFALLQAGGDAALRRALDFYRGAGATRYVRQAEAQLARAS